MRCHSERGLFRAKHLLAANPASLLNLAYSYDPYGNVASLSDSGTTHTFSYDAQNRLLSAYGKEYAYDEAGRLTHYEGKTLVPDATRPHALKAANSDTSYYLYHGNMHIRDSERGMRQSLSWNDENRLTKVTANNNVLESYFYDADGIRVKKGTGGQATYYVNQYYEVQGPDTQPASVLASATVSQPDDGPVSPLAAAEEAQPVAAGFVPRLFLPVVAQVKGDIATEEQNSEQTPDGAVTYARASTGAGCVPGSSDDCMAWVVSTPTTATALAPTITAVDVVLPLPTLTSTLPLTATEVLWERPTTLLPNEQWALPAEAAVSDAEVMAAAVITISNADFQDLNSTGTRAVDWSAYRPDPTAFPNASGWANSVNIASGRDNPADGATPHRGQSLSNLAYGWLESSNLNGLTAGATYSFTVDIRGALDADNNSQGRWLVRAVFVNSSGTPLAGVAPVVVAQGDASGVNPDNWQRLGGLVTVPISPTGVSRVRLHLVNELNAG